MRTTLFLALAACGRPATYSPGYIAEPLREAFDELDADLAEAGYPQLLSLAETGPRVLAVPSLPDEDGDDNTIVGRANPFTGDIVILSKVMAKKYVLAHEIGHTLGLSHTAHKGLMSEVFNTECLTREAECLIKELHEQGVLSDE